MNTFYADVPDYLRITGAPTRNTTVIVSKPKSKVPWTPALIRGCWEMHQRGVYWDDVAKEVERLTGVLIKGEALGDYVTHKHDEGEDEEVE